MVEKMSGYIVDNVLYKGEKIEGDQREIMMFGITRVLEDIPKFILIFIIALFLNLLKELAIVAGTILVYKTFIGGAHARTNLICFICSSLFFITPGVIARYFEFSNVIFFICLLVIDLFSIYVILKYAPADTEEVPILNKRKQNTMKILALISLVVININLLFFIKINYLREIILITILYTNLMTTNVAYKILKCTRAKDSEEFKDCF